MKIDDDGKFTNTGDKYLSYSRNISQHKTNFVVYKNVFTGEIRKTNSLAVFVKDMTMINKGKNICVAHNAAGYDSRFIWDELANIFPNLEATQVIVKGTKIMRMVYGDTVFIDSLLHLPGSLSKLAADVLKGRTDMVIEKGYFPHLFNTPENQDYIGSIPDIENFDLTFTIKTDGDLNKFNEWYATWQGRKDWSFKAEMEKYCTNDVELLCEIVKSHHYNCIKAVTGISAHAKSINYSPFTKTTAAGYSHSIGINYLSILSEIPEMPKLEDEDYEEKKNIVLEKTKQVADNGWCTLYPEEYYFARKALRGGRTEIRKHYHKGEIKYMDIMSEYPAVQLLDSIECVDQTIQLLYPVGPPTIKVYNPFFVPCKLHNTESSCICPQANRKSWAKYELLMTQPTDQEMLTFFGIACVDITPSKLYHPVITYKDVKRNKSIFGCEPIEKVSVASPELQLALRLGYKITKVHRVDHYKSKESLWKQFLGELYKLKLYNSQPAESSKPSETTPEWQTRQFQFYRNIGINIDFSDWGKRPALKLTGKILINSAWGKHAQSVDHQKVEVIPQHDRQSNHEMFDKCQKGNYDLKNIKTFGDSTIYKFLENRLNTAPVLNKGYLPCAVFVPMYGRMMLYNHLHKLGERVLMCDTDSIIYHNEGVAGEHEIQESDVLGGWEEEPGIITEFVAVGPKSYSLRYADGGESTKTKGVCLKRAHNNMVNFEFMKDTVDKGIKAVVPQLQFANKNIDGIHGTYTKYDLKEFGFDEAILKGVFQRQNYKVYPFGY
jgi:hypothetical protein